MKKGYWIVAYRTIGDEATMKSYVALAGAALRPFGSRLLVSPGSAVTAIATRSLWLRMRVRTIRGRWLRLARVWREIFGLLRGF